MVKLFLVIKLSQTIFKCCNPHRPYPLNLLKDPVVAFGSPYFIRYACNVFYRFMLFAWNKIHSFIHVFPDKKASGRNDHSPTFMKANDSELRQQQ